MKQNNYGLSCIPYLCPQLVYGHFVYDTSSTDISSTDISSTMTFLAEMEAGVMKLARSGIDENKRV